MTSPDTNIGHNSGAAPARSFRDGPASVTDDRLRLLIERAERLEEEKAGIADDIRDVVSEAKAVGYDGKLFRQLLRLRKMDPDKRHEEETVLELYKCALGMG